MKEIRIQNLKLRIADKTILGNINLNLEPEKMIMILGANGAGKTMLIKSIMGFNKIREGSITYGDKSLITMSPKARARLLSYIPQVSEQITRYRVSEFVSMGLMPHTSFYRAPSKKMRKKVDDMLARLAIYNLKDNFTDQISGGEYRIAYVARALMQDTPWLLLDEPISSLDFEKQHEFMGLIQDIMREEKKGIFLSIHDPNVAIKYADRLIFIKEGIIIDEIDNIENNIARIHQDLKMIYGSGVEIEQTDKGPIIVWDKKKGEEEK